MDRFHLRIVRKWSTRREARLTFSKKRRRAEAVPISPRTNLGNVKSASSRTLPTGGAEVASEPTRHLRISYAVFCLKKNKTTKYKHMKLRHYTHTTTEAQVDNLLSKHKHAVK